MAVMPNRRRFPLHPGYELLIGQALVDKECAARLLRDPKGAALRAGLAAAEAELIADIHAEDLGAFCRILVPRLYGEDAPHAPARRAAV